MRNSSNRRKFRNLAFSLQLAPTEDKVIILREMIDVLKIEQDQEEILDMHRTITTNIIVHNLVIGLGKNEHNITSAVAANG